MIGVSIKKIVDEVLHVRIFESLRAEIERIFLDSLLGGSPRLTRRALRDAIENALGDPARDTLSFCENSPELLEAYIDVCNFRTPIQTAAKDADCVAGDLVWLLGKRPVCKEDVKKFKPSRKLKRRRKVDCE